MSRKIWHVAGSNNNIPKKDSDRYIRGTVPEPGKIRISSYKDAFSEEIEKDFECINYTITEFIIDDRWSPQALADAIAQTITAARDIGFEQGRAHVRKALGI
jgi:hypothetical protein